jgi:hypothetical protein
VGAGEEAGDIFRDGGGDQDLLGFRHEGGKAVPAARVELGEDVIEDQHRVLAAGPEQVEAGQAERERERPGLAVAGVAARRQAANAELKLVAVRASEADAPVKLARADLKQCFPERLLRGSHPFPVGRSCLVLARLARAG